MFSTLILLPIYTLALVSLMSMILAGHLNAGSNLGFLPIVKVITDEYFIPNFEFVAA
jgi:hypothetical protein